MSREDSDTGRSVGELRELAKEQGIKGYTRMKRDELVAALAGDPAPPPPAAASPSESYHAVAEAPSSGMISAPRPMPVEAPHHFPFSYGVDKVVVLVRDPQWLFCYWDISSATWDEVQKRGLNDPDSGWRRVLRLHDLTGTGGEEPSDATIVQVLEVAAGAIDWYFQAPQADRVYLVEFGYLSADGQFFLVARSNLATVPRMSPSDVMDEEWGHLYDEAYRLSLAGGDPTSVGSMTSADITRRVEEFLAEGLSSGFFSAGAAHASARA